MAVVGELLYDGPEPCDGPCFARGPTQDTMDEAVSNEPQVELQIGGVASVVFLVLADNVNGNDTKPN